jgi:hypothetical protein
MVFQAVFVLFHDTFPIAQIIWNWDSSVRIVTRLRAGRPGSISGRGRGIFFSPSSRPDRSWGPPNLLRGGYWWFFPRGQGELGVKLTTDLYFLLRSSWRGTLLSTRTTLPLALNDKY